MAKYRKKPVIINAVQWTGDNVAEINSFTNPHSSIKDGNLSINTLEGVMSATIGDFIIQGVNGEFYPCKPDIFEKTYEAVLPTPTLV